MSTESMVQTIFRQYPQGEAFLRGTCRLWAGGFSGAGIYRLDCEAGNFCLRAWPPNSFPKRRLLGLHRLLEHIANAGVTQVANPVRANSGETLVSDGRQYWQLEPWKPGRADFQDHPSQQRLAHTMETLARVHQAMANYRVSHYDKEWFFHETAVSSAVRERLALLNSWIHEKQYRLAEALSLGRAGEFHEIAEIFFEGFRLSAAFVEDGLQRLASITFSLHPCWRDLWHDHVLFEGDFVSGLIDASACRSDHVATDLSRLLGSFVEDDRDQWDFAIDHYSKFHPLDDRDRTLIECLYQSGVLLSAMTWMDRLILQQEVPSDLPAIQNRLAFLSRRISALVDKARSL